MKYLNIIYDTKQCISECSFLYSHIFIFETALNVNLNVPRRNLNLYLKYLNTFQSHVKDKEIHFLVEVQKRNNVGVMTIIFYRILQIAKMLNEGGGCNNTSFTRE